MKSGETQEREAPGATRFSADEWPAALSLALPMAAQAKDLHEDANIDLKRRAFDAVNGFNREDGLVEPIVTLEFVSPAEWFGSAATAAMVGQPALNVQAACERNWSNAPLIAGAAVGIHWLATGYITISSVRPRTCP